jgi:hypothetical protein
MHCWESFHLDKVMGHSRHLHRLGFDGIRNWHGIPIVLEWVRVRRLVRDVAYSCLQFISMMTITTISFISLRLPDTPTFHGSRCQVYGVTSFNR